MGINKIEVDFFVGGSLVCSMGTLFIILKRKYFDEILSGEKTEEYREIKKYWINKLGSEYDKIIFQDGYSTNRRIEAKYLGYEKKIIHHELFGREPKEVFAIKFKIK